MVEHYVEGFGSNLTMRKRQYKIRKAASKYAAASTGRKSYASILAMTAVAMRANAATMSSPIKSLSFDSDQNPIGIDKRCSTCISNCIQDFDGPMTETRRVIKGIEGARITPVMKGTIKWSWLDEEGITHKFTIPNSFYIPSSGARLLSPQHWAQTQKDKSGTGCTTDGYGVTMYWKQKQFQLFCPLNPQTNVANIYSAPGIKKYQVFLAEAALDDTNPPVTVERMEISKDTYDAEDIITVPTDRWQAARTVPIPSRVQNSATKEKYWCQPCMEKEPSLQQLAGQREGQEMTQQEKNMAELLHYHHIFHHMPFAKLQQMAKDGIIPKRLADTPIPTCAACMFARAKRKVWRSKSSKEAALPPVYRPGDRVSVDQLTSSPPGLVAQMTGFRTSKRYKYAIVFVDQASKFSYIYLQKTQSAEETVQGTIAFEQFSRNHGITIQSYHGDNGIFKANKLVGHCALNTQGLTYAGVSAHHQNGVAERRMSFLQELTRANLLHAMHKWPSTITINLWPHAMRMANDALNNSPNLKDKSKRTPLQIFTGTTVNVNQKHWQPFGCPVAVLAEPLVDGKPFNKWDPRANVGIYLGRSPLYVKNIALVMDRKTGYISPQFHVVFDDRFMVAMDFSKGSAWQIQTGFFQQPSSKSSQNQRENTPQQLQSVGKEPATIVEDKPTEKPKTIVDQQLGINNVNMERPSKRRIILQSHDSSRTLQENNREMTTRSGRKIIPVDRLIPVMSAEIIADTQTGIEGELFCPEASFPGGTEYDEQHPFMAYKATSDPDTMYLHKAMKQPDKIKFLKRIQKKVRDQRENGNFTIVARKDVLENALILPAVWQMKRKRDIITRRVKKYKARLNLDGSRMRKGEHYEESYSPVAKWNSIRTVLILSAMNKWHTKQIDYVHAFPQAPIDREIYMKIPKGFDLGEGIDPNDYVLQIHRNVYGKKDGGRVWNQYLTKKLIQEIGFK